MEMERLGFWARLWLAFILPWKLIFNSVLAARVRRVTRGEPLAPTLAAAEASVAEAAEAVLEQEKTAEPPAARVVDVEPEALPQQDDATGALQLLSILQREGRLIDFLQEDVAAFSDAEIGAAARVVHEGVKRGLEQYVVLAPVRNENEGENIVLEAGFDASRVRITGNVVGQPPFRGRLAHHGWQVSEVRLPALVDGQDPKIVAPAEVEL